MSTTLQIVDPAEFVKDFTTAKYAREIKTWNDPSSTPKNLAHILLDLKAPTAALAEIGLTLAEEVLPVFEKKCPSDPRPRKAVKAGKAWLKDRTEANYNAAQISSWAAADAARAASDANSEDASNAAWTATHALHNIEVAVFYARYAGLPNQRAFGIIKKVGHDYFAFLSEN
jgi:hypothetical protein